MGWIYNTFKDLIGWISSIYKSHKLKKQKLEEIVRFSDSEKRGEPASRAFFEKAIGSRKHDYL